MEKILIFIIHLSCEQKVKYKNNHYVLNEKINFKGKLN